MVTSLVKTAQDAAEVEESVSLRLKKCHTGSERKL